ncbi:MAG: hypothetical protein ABJP34_03415 [Erythrobacter sp.]
MKLLLVFSLTLFTSCVSAKDEQVQEASTNFNLQDVDPFLVGLAANQGVFLDAASIYAFTAQTKLDEERCTEIEARFEGNAEKLNYCVYMDDVEAPDVYFFSKNTKVVNAISKEISAYVERLGR